MLASILIMGEGAGPARVVLDTDVSPQLTSHPGGVCISAHCLQLAAHLDKWTLALPWKKAFFR